MIYSEYLIALLVFILGAVGHLIAIKRYKIRISLEWKFISGAIEFLIIGTTIVFLPEPTVYSIGVIETMAFGTLLLPLRWNFHDVIINLGLGRSINYTGDPNFEKALSDRFLDWFEPVPPAFTRLLVLVLVWAFLDTVVTYL